MIGPQSKLMFQVNKFCGERVHARKYAISKTVREVCKVVQGRERESEAQCRDFVKIRFFNIINMKDHFMSFATLISANIKEGKVPLVM